MKRIIYTLLLLTVGLCAHAQAKVKEVKAGELKKAIEAVEFINDKLREQEKDLNGKIAKADSLCMSVDSLLKLSDKRKFIPGASQTSQSFDIEKFLGKYNGISDICKAQNIVGKNLEKNAPDSEMKTTYLLVLDMWKSLKKPYDEAENDRLIKEAKLHKTVLPKHQPGFDELVAHINDYNYYMFELARIFVAADEDKYKKDADVLVVDEDAPYLMDVPYISNVLKEYIDNKRKKGDLTDLRKEELVKSCPDAFSDFF